MSDLKAELNRIGRRIEPAPDALERLAERRHARQRTRRIGTATVALAIGIAGVLAVVPVLRPSDGAVEGPNPGGPLPAVVDVVCDDQGVHSLTDVVRALPDGVHFSVDNRTSEPVFISVGYRSEDGGGGYVDSKKLAPGVTEVVMYVDPSRPEIACSATDRSGPWVDLRIVDPDGAWLEPPSLDCEGRELDPLVDLSSLAAWEHRRGIEDPLAEVQTWEGLREGDDVRYVEYPESAEQRRVVISRNGVTVAWFTFHFIDYASGDDPEPTPAEDRIEGWFIPDIDSGCGGTGI